MVITEQNPARLGSTASELDLQGHVVHEKMLFSMITPEIDQLLKEKKRDSAVVFGLEVRNERKNRKNKNKAKSHVLPLDALVLVADPCVCVADDA